MSGSGVSMATVDKFFSSFEKTVDTSIKRWKIDKTEHDYYLYEFLDHTLLH